MRVGVTDQRGELGAVYRGRALFDLGPRTDLLCGCPRAKGMAFLLRAMNPQVLAVDEVAGEEDAAALMGAAGCGVSLLATAHGEDLDGLMRRPATRVLLEEGIFQRLVTIRGRGAERTYHVEVLG